MCQASQISQMLLKKSGFIKYKLWVFDSTPRFSHQIFDNYENVLSTKVNFVIDHNTEGFFYAKKICVN